ncbi:hypothetical protein K493DRAFT_313030 [Basidiobolus meristosporus CBS 931.73]|uniref:Extracellular membrane protein CFEM domain-containing protein n=1 Tax=Basidiobolus meristosporus CBS 931.73 TaxID=1314790 RepID=A0A1Y1YPM7_9FUNG|nr:hypothetical protein K493DRAFT_313030 [Basidiobolus meristosporus CBS 931.73]|eukprot:ORX99935.1 hypothetical protein K493DRAFT_313030 [Basidiobolus meristosporus CBS 931.73]
MISGKLLLVSALVATAMAATTADHADARIKCTKEHNCGTDINCIARCYNVPNPSKEDIESTDACFADCKSHDNIAVLTQCRQACVNEHFQPTGAPTANPTTTSTSAKHTETSVSKTESDSKSSSATTSVSTSASSSHSSSHSSSSDSSTHSETPSPKPEDKDHKNSASSQAPLLSVISVAAVFAAVSTFL